MATDFSQAINDAQRAGGAGAGLDAPLAALDAAGYSYTNFIYPTDLGAPGAGKDHYMVFHINVAGGTQFGGGSAYAGSSYTVSDPSAYDQGVAAGQLADNANGVTLSGVTNTDATSDPNGTGVTGASGGTLVQKVIANIRQPIQRVATTIVLYMPDSIVAGYGAKWSQEQLGWAGDVGGALAQKESMVDALRSGGASAVRNLGTTLDTITGTQISNTASHLTRLAVNNHLELLFEGIEFRTFRFNFRFAPQNETEALNVDNIIRAFKFHQAPEVLVGTAGRFWIYPSTFDIQYFSNGQENLFINKISTCAMTDFQVNYTPTGHWTAHRAHSIAQGSPGMITDISMSLTELELMTKDRVLLGY